MGMQVQKGSGAWNPLQALGLRARTQKLQALGLRARTQKLQALGLRARTQKLQALGLRVALHCDLHWRLALARAQVQLQTQALIVQAKQAVSERECTQRPE
jgi:selenocysteine lyase/cysteine desulfurase